MLSCIRSSNSASHWCSPSMPLKVTEMQSVPSATTGSQVTNVPLGTHTGLPCGLRKQNSRRVRAVFISGCLLAHHYYGRNRPIEPGEKDQVRGSMPPGSP